MKKCIEVAKINVNRIRGIVAVAVFSTNPDHPAMPNVIKMVEIPKNVMSRVRLMLPSVPSSVMNSRTTAILITPVISLFVASTNACIKGIVPTNLA